MDRNFIVTQLYKQKVVRQIIQNLSHGRESPDNLKDLEQDIYIEILTSKADIEGMYQRGELNYWLAGVIQRQMHSKTSKYYYTYKKDEYKTLESAAEIPYIED